MSALQNILVATDLSSPARQAAERAAMLAHEAGASLRLVHALGAGLTVQLQQLLGLGTPLEAALIEQTRHDLQALAAELSAERQAAVEPALVQGERARLTAEQQLYSLAASCGLARDDWTPCVCRSNASLAIVEQEQEQACDLIVIGKHGRNMAEELLLGSITSHVLAESVADVLVSNSTLGANDVRAH